MEQVRKSRKEKKKSPVECRALDLRKKTKKRGIMTLSSNIELFLFKGHSKHELIKFHCSAVVKTHKYYHLHFMAGGTESEAEAQPAEANKEMWKMVSMGFAGSAFFLGHLDITVSLTVLGIPSLTALAGSEVYCSPCGRGRAWQHMRGWGWERDRGLR